MEDFISWVNGSEIRKKNEERDDFNYTQLHYIQQNKFFHVYCFPGRKSLGCQVFKYFCRSAKPQMEDEESIRDYEIYLEQSVVVMLLDGRYLYGLMKSFDQFISIALNMGVERIFHGIKYAERKHELFVVRGENISMIGLGCPDVNVDLEIEDFDVLNGEIYEFLEELKIS